MLDYSLEERLGQIIADERAGEIADEFYEEVTKKQFDYYYSSATGHKPILNADLHGGFVSNGKYYMIAKKKVAPKIGKKTSLKQELRYQQKLALKLMAMGFDEKVIKSKEGNQIVLRLGYSGTLPYEYKMFYVDYAGDEIEAPHSIMKGGRFSSLDKLIIRSVRRLAEERNLRVNLSITGGDFE